MDLNYHVSGGELFMHLEREGIFMEDTATYGLEFLSAADFRIDSILHVILNCFVVQVLSVRNNHGLRAFT
jgi:hypothetical protein